MLVLAAPGAGAFDLALAQTGDVDEHAVSHVDPAGVDDVHAVATVNVDVVGVDVEQVRLDDELVGVGIGIVVGVLGAVEVVAEPLQGAVGDLDVEVVVPGHDLAVPPPAQQGAVGEPGLDAVLVQHRQVAADEVAQDEAVVLVGYLLLEVSRVVVAELEGAAGLGEVLGRPVALRQVVARLAGGFVERTGGTEDGRGERGEAPEEQ